MYYLRAPSSNAANHTNILAQNIEDATVQAIVDGKMTFRGVMANFRERHWSVLCQKGNLEEALLNTVSKDEMQQMCQVLAPFFVYYDRNCDNRIDFGEFCMILRDVNEHLSKEAKVKMFKSASTDQGFIDFEGFVSSLLSFALDSQNEMRESSERQQNESGSVKYLTGDKGPQNRDEDNTDEEEEDDSRVHDIAEVEPAKQQMRIKQRAFFLISFGIALIIVFAHPMVGLLSEIGERLGISSFYVSFIVAPLLLNANRLSVAQNYAARQTMKSMTQSLHMIVGAAIVNNTFCLGIFLLVTYFNQLAWKFSAEACSIVIIQFILGLSVCCRKVHRLLDGFIALACYPASLLIVWWLKEKYGMDEHIYLHLPL